MNKNLFSVAIIGCGLIGNKRALSLGDRGLLKVCVDKDIDNAKKLASNFEAEFLDDHKPLLERKDIDIVIISTLHNSLAELTHQFMLAGKHVLVEKPCARDLGELELLLKASKESNSKVRVGFNHRFHRSVLKAKEIIEDGELGELMFLRARYGHGGRLGYDREWRSKPELSGGGELIDQGSHLIDLSRLFLGEFSHVDGLASTFFWNMPVDDNAFMTLRTEQNKVAFLHASCTEWKNLFSMEIYGKKGKLDLSGLGGSYGIEKITFYKMLAEMGPPETRSWEYPTEDVSWINEINAFYDDIELNKEPNPSIIDAFKSMEIIQQIYKVSGYDHST